MKNNHKVIIVSSALVILGLYYFYKESKQSAESANEEVGKATNSFVPIAKADFNKLLKKGSKGIEVGILQKALKTLKIDSDFGEKTELRLKKVMNVTETSLNNYNKFINRK